MRDRSHVHLEQALEWFFRLQDESCTADDRQAFEQWLATGEAQRRAYAEAEMLWNNMDSLRHMSVPGLHEARRARRSPSKARLGLASVLLALLLGGTWYRYGAETEIYATALGEHRTATLADGTRVELNTDTRIRVRYSRARRDVELEKGEALFSVSRDMERPFAVAVQGWLIRDIGTRFDVYSNREGFDVAVLDGEVELRGARLAAGQRRHVGNDADQGLLETADRERIEGWTHGRLVFNRTPLEEVTAELERYHPVHFVFADAALARETLSGNFDSADLEPCLRAVEKILPIRTEHAPDQRITFYRASRR